MRSLYSRFVLWLIRPALEASAPKVDSQMVIDVMLKDLRRNGPVSHAMHQLEGDCVHRSGSGSR